LTSGASCPDTLVDRVMLRLVSFFDEAKPLEEVMRLY
jgi:4-hydroxy-3-methylbut-2-enyl diphosphate reductase